MKVIINATRYDLNEILERRMKKKIVVTKKRSRPRTVQIDVMVLLFAILLWV